jgi:hypothetical protein
MRSEEGMLLDRDRRSTAHSSPVWGIWSRWREQNFHQENISAVIGGRQLPLPPAMCLRLNGCTARLASLFSGNM